MKFFIIFILICLTNSIYSQTVENFKLEHIPSKLTGKLHIVNTSSFKMDSLLYTFYTFGNQYVVKFSTGYGNDPYISYGTLDSIIPNRHGINDTIMTLHFKCDAALIKTSGTGAIVGFKTIKPKLAGNTDLNIQLPDLEFPIIRPTIDNFKIEHKPSKLTGKLHVINTPGCKMDSLLYTYLPNTTIVTSSYHQLNIGNYDSIIPNENNAYDTVMTLSFNINQADAKYIEYLIFNYKEPDSNIMYNPNGYNSFSINIPISFTQFLKSDQFTPCYASISPNKNKPIVYWESISDNMISHYIIKRNGINIDTLSYMPGTMFYLDSTNLDAASFVQSYTIEAVDSSQNHLSGGNVTTLRVRNLASVDGNIEMDWTMPTTSATINNIIIFEYKILDELHDTLIVINTLPPNITQYTISNPKPNSSYLVGTSNLNCSGTALKSLNSNLLLSNKLYVKGYTPTIGVESINIIVDDEIIGYFDLMGREISSNTINQVIITRYKSGKIEKIINVF